MHVRHGISFLLAGSLISVCSFGLAQANVKQNPPPTKHAKAAPNKHQDGPGKAVKAHLGGPSNGKHGFASRDGSESHQQPPPTKKVQSRTSKRETAAKELHQDQPPTRHIRNVSKRHQDGPG